MFRPRKPGNKGLNPCFSGGWSRRVQKHGVGESYFRLNPCFSGGWSRRYLSAVQKSSTGSVLILVLVEDGLGVVKFILLSQAPKGLNPCFSGGWSRSLSIQILSKITSICLNPCFSGGWSRRIIGSIKRPMKVLILVLVEDGLGVSQIAY